MKRALVFATLFLSGSVLAETGKDPFIGGDAEAGAAKAAACVACHGQGGNSSNPEWPKLAGQHATYILGQLQALKSGERSVPLMIGQLDDMSEQDLKDISAYFSVQPSTPGIGSPDSLAIADPLYRNGDASRGLPACSSCHGPKGAGNAGSGYPRIGGQHATYVGKMLRDFRGLANGLAAKQIQVSSQNMKTMAEVAAKLSDAEIDALASYINGLN